MKSLLILGAGLMQKPAITIAKAKGYKVCVADGNRDAVCKALADEFLHIDLKDKEALLQAAKNIENLSGVFTAGTDFSASVAYITESLGLPGLSHETALNASNKARMRDVLYKAGVPIPRYAYGTANDEPEVLASSFAAVSDGSQQSMETGAILFPLVVKPVDNMGARGCRLAYNLKDLKTAWLDALANSRSGQAIIEEYIEGPEFSIDALVIGKEIILRGIADRIIVFEPFFVELGHTMPSEYGIEILDEVVAVFKQAVMALGINHGVAKGDIKYSRQGAFVGEIAARLSGGYMSGWTYPYSSGIEPTAEAIDLASNVISASSLAESIRQTQPPLNLVCAERAYISIPGKIAEIQGLDKASAMPNIKNIFERNKAGDETVFPSNNVQKCGNILAVAETHTKAISAAEEAVRTILIRMEPCHAKTEAFLKGADAIKRGQSLLWPPAAFSSISAMTIASVDSMPDMLRLSDKPNTLSLAPIYLVHDELCVDWHGRSINASLLAVEKLTGATVGMHGDIVFGSIFWKALFLGGYQAAVYVIDSHIARIKKPEDKSDKK